MRVLHILEATGGGAARHVLDLCAGLARRGVEVHLAYSSSRMDRIFQEGLSALSQSGVALLEVPMRRSLHPNDLRALNLIRRYLWSQASIDLIHGHSSKGGGLARLLRLGTKAKVVYTPHTFVTLFTNIKPFERFSYGLAEKSLSLLTEALIAVSENEAREAYRLGFSQRKIHIIPNGISLTFSAGQNSQSLREAWGLPKPAKVVGFVGRFVPEKNLLLLLEAFAKISTKHSDARLVMIGDGPLKPLLLQRCEILGLGERVIWPGFMDGRQAMRAFDIFALSSDYEGFPYVLLEAMAEGLPLVATRVGGTELAIREGENGFVVPIGDIQGFAQSLDLLLSDTALRRRMGENSRIWVQQFTVDKMVEATLALYKELLQE